MTAITMALDSIFEKKGRSFLTMLGIIIGVTAVLVLVDLVEGYNTDMTAYYEKIGVNKVEVSIEFLDVTRSADDTNALSTYCDEELSQMVNGGSPLATSRNASVSFGDFLLSDTTISFGNEDYATCANYILEQGRELSFLDVANRNKVIVLGSYVADTLFPYINPVGETILLNSSPYTVIGTYFQKDGDTESSMDHVVTLPYSLTRSLLGSNHPTEYVVKVATSTQMDVAMVYREDWFWEQVSSVATVTVENGNASMLASQEEMTSMSVVLGGVTALLST